MPNFDSSVNALVSSITNRQKEYLEECAEYRARGHRHNYCFHGMNQWVDYDCACGACEDGAIDEHSSLEEIREYAKEVVANYDF